MTELRDVMTPAAIVDEARMMQNIARMQGRMNALGVSLRPHVKTSKCFEVAGRQSAQGARGITVSTLKEAERFHAAGFDDILYAACIPPGKIDRALALRRQGCKLTLIVDSVEAARALADRGTAERHVFDVMIEVDSDGHRSGVKPAYGVLVDIARTLSGGSAMLKGVLTHAGSSYDLSNPDALEHLAEQERREIVAAAERLRAAGFPCPVVSVGSTPTALAARNLAGVTEVRAGVYVFFDLVMANVGACATKDVALSVLATVIGHQVDKGWAIVDAGWMAMSRDRGTARQARDYGYGAVCDLDGNPIEGFTVAAANQEHGIVSSSEAHPAGDIAMRFPIGSLIRILPNHACATGAQHDAYHVVDGHGQVAVWNRFNGW